MSYKLLTPGQKAVNRDRTIQHFAWLTGTYQQFCHVSAHTKENGRYNGNTRRSATLTWPS